MPDAPAQEKIYPIIIVHAITAGGLHDHYPIDQERVWGPGELAFKLFDRISLYPTTGIADERMRYEAHGPSLVRPSEVFKMIYGELVAELKHNLSYAKTPVQPVYTYSYDWRQNNFYTIRHFAAFVQEVIERTNQMRYDSTKVKGALCDSVDLVGHSMGGIVIAGCLASNLLRDNNGVPVVRRVVTLGTPFRGANAAIRKLAVGGDGFVFRGGSERERTMARVTPSVYQLLPSFAGTLRDKNDKPLDTGGTTSADLMFDSKTFQPSVRDTLAEFVQDVVNDASLASDKAACKKIATQVFGEMLDSARRYRELVEQVSPQVHLLPANKGGAWLAIVGAGEETMTRTKLGVDQYGQTRFDMDNCSCKDSWNGTTTDTGDETVPLLGAMPPWADSWKNTVVVQRQDVPWLGEGIDRALINGAVGFHGALPLVDLAQRWIINFFRPKWADTPSLGQHGRLWGRALPNWGGTQITKQPTKAELQAVWGEMIPGLSLSEVP